MIGREVCSGSTSRCRRSSLTTHLRRSIPSASCQVHVTSSRRCYENLRRRTRIVTALATVEMADVASENGPSRRRVVGADRESRSVLVRGGLNEPISLRPDEDVH